VGEYRKTSGESKRLGRGEGACANDGYVSRNRHLRDVCKCGQRDRR